MRGGQFSRALPAVGECRPPERIGQLIRPGWPPLHGASRNDDAGISPVPGQRHRLPEDGRDQRLLPARSGLRLPARPDPVAGPHARRHGADRRSLDSALGVRLVGVARRGLAGDVGGSARPGQPGRGREGRPHPPALSAEQPARAQPAGQGDGTPPSQYWFLGHDQALARRAEHDSSVRHHGVRHRSAHVGAGPVLPYARRGQSVRGRRVILPILRRRQPGADDRRSGAARRRSHRGTRSSRLHGRAGRSDEPMKVRSFSHTGITVSDFGKAVRFYWEVFGCPLVGVADTPPERVRSFFGVAGEASDNSPRCKIGWIRVPGGAVLEIFEFQPQLPPRAVPWNGVGLTHISFNVRNLAKWHDYLTRKGVECLSRPEQSPRGHWFFFAKDFDGNLIELMDLGYMYYVLGWLGPLGGWVFRRGMYRKYYE